MENTSRVLIKGYFRRRKKEWSSISLVVFLCVVFFSTIISSCWEAISSIEQYTKYQYGSHQFQIFDVDKDAVKGSGINSQANVGTMELKGYFINEVSLYRDAVILGVVDEKARKIGNLSVTEGRMPEKKGEIAVEASVLRRMGKEDLSVGDKIDLSVYWANDGQYGENTSAENFTITGIIRDYSRIWMDQADDPYRGFPGVWLSESENEGSGIKVELLQFDQIKTPEQAEQYYQELWAVYGDALEYNLNSYMASEDDSTEARKSLYVTIAAVIMGGAIVIIMIIGIVSILSLGIEERKKQQNILHQLGMNQRQCFGVLCGQIYGASLIGILPGLLFSVILSKGLKVLLLRVLGIYVPGNTSIQLILASIFPILLTIGAASTIIYKMINKGEVKQVRKSKIPDYIQRICNGSFQAQRMFSIILLLSTLLIILPVQIIINYYQDYFSYPLEKDVNIYLETMSGNGSLQVSEGRQGINVKDYEQLEQIDGLEDMSYVMQLESGKILLPDAKAAKKYESYRSDSETIAPIQNMDAGDGVDYLTRDKKYYGYPEESALIPCTILGIEWETIEELSSYLIDGRLAEKSYMDGEEIFAVVWEEEYENAEYPVQVGDTITLSNLVQTKPSQNYWEKPDEADRVDTTAKVGGIIKLPLGMQDKLCAFTRGSFTFLRAIDALGKDGHDISFQNISFNYTKDADMRLVDEQIKEIVSAYSYVNFESKYEKQKAAEEFQNVVYILGGSIWGLGLCLAIVLIYQKMISTIILKKQQLHIMWCMGMHKDRLKTSVKKESICCVGCAAVIALIVAGVISRFVQGINLWVTCLFIAGSSIVALAVLNYFLLRWIKRVDL